MDRRLSRRNPRLRLAAALGAVALAVPALASCGFNVATDREYTPAAGVNDKSGVVDILNATIVSSEEGSGTFLASLSNNSTTDTIALESLSFGSNSTIQVAAFSPIAVDPHGLVNLANGQGIKVSGAFKQGDFVALTLSFDNGESAEMKVPVVTATYQWEDMDNGTGSPSPAPSSPAPSESAQ